MKVNKKMKEPSRIGSSRVESGRKEEQQDSRDHLFLQLVPVVGLVIESATRGNISQSGSMGRNAGLAAFTSHIHRLALTTAIVDV